MVSLQLHRWISSAISARGHAALGKSLNPFIYGLFTFLVFIVLFGMLTHAEYEKYKANNRSEAVHYSSMLRTQVDRELNALLFISSGLASYLSVYHNELKAEKIEAILADLYSRSQHVRNLAISVGYRMTYVYPRKSNEKIIGLDYRDLPQQWPQVKQAVDTRRGVLVGPLDLVQGGKGLIYRYPIFIEGKYWGILSTVINTGSFLQAAFQDIPDKGYAFAIRVKETPAVPAFYGDARLFDDRDAYTLVSNVPSGQWEWAIKKKTSDMPKLILMMGLMGFAISLLLGSLVFYFTLERTRLTMEAMYDSLTGVANRRLLQDRMNQAFEQARRFGRAMAVIYIDLDHFKRLNDEYGHDFGDELLKVTARKLSGCVRNVDTLSRVGGDEFIIVLEEISDSRAVRPIVDNILETFKEPSLVFDINIRIELSLGIAIYEPGSDLTLQALLKRADIALYEAKGTGRNIYRIFGES